MIRVVSWNIFKKWPPWHVLVEMARQGEADVALLQEAGNPPSDLTQPVQYGADEFWKHEQHEGRPIYDRWSLVVQLSDRVEVEWFRAVPPISELGTHDNRRESSALDSSQASKAWTASTNCRL